MNCLKKIIKVAKNDNIHIGEEKAKKIMNYIAFDIVVDEDIFDDDLYLKSIIRDYLVEVDGWELMK